MRFPAFGPDTVPLRSAGSKYNDLGPVTELGE
jgi:hypothetical protein